MRLSNIAKRVLNEMTVGEPYYTFALRIDDAKSAMTDEEYIAIFPKFGLKFVSQDGYPDTDKSEMGRSSYYTLTVSGKDKAMDNFISKYPEGIDVNDIKPADDLEEEIVPQQGSSPAANSASPIPSASPGSSASKFYDVLKDFQSFETLVDRQTETAKKNLQSTIGKNLVNKKVTVRASKGAVGQIEKDYTITVSGTDVSYLNDEYYIILKDKDKKDYYLNPAFKVKVYLPTSTATDTDSPAANVVSNKDNNAQSSLLNKHTNMAYPQTMGLGSNTNIGKPR